VIVATIIVGIVAATVVGLVLVDLHSMRNPERFGAEEGSSERFDDAEVEAGEGAYRAQPTVGARLAAAPPMVRVSAIIAGVFGALSFPGTLAPVILTVLAMQVRPLGGDGFTSLGAVIVAALSMSAAVKTIRTGRLLVELREKTRDVLRRCMLWLLAWNVIVVGLALVFPWGSEHAAGHVTTIVAVYTVLSILVFALLAGSARRALRFVAETSPADDEVEVPAG